MAKTGQAIKAKSIMVMRIHSEPPGIESKKLVLNIRFSFSGFKNQRNQNNQLIIDYIFSTTTAVP